jgi:LuxR family maltose regulon positive regulatory protein
MQCDTPVVCIVAGAGYGKTTLARQWDAADDRDFVWLELQPSDDDPVVFMRLLLDSLGRLMDTEEAAEAAREPHPRFADRVLPALAGATRAHGRPIVLVIDDVELIGSEVAELLCEVLARLPSDVQTVLLGRSMPLELRLARREIQGSLLELRAEDLAFTIEEATSLFERVTPATDPHSVADIVDLTTGWPIGLHLAAMAAREGSAPLSCHDVLAGDRELLLRYLDEELLVGLEPHDRTFLLESSVLEWLDPELCDEVLETDGSRDRLARLVADGRVLFVSGGTRRALRFHPLLREYLLAQFRTRHTERELHLRRRAVAAYETLGQHRTAVDSAIASGDPVLAEEVLFRHLPTIIFNGENTLLARWLGHFSHQDEQRRSGLLALTEAWFAFLTNRRADLLAWLDVADSLGHDGPMPDGSASLEVATAVVKMLAGVGGIPASAHYARVVYEAGPQGSPWWGVASGIEAVVNHMLGLTTDIREPLRAAEFESRGLHASHATTCAHLGFAELRCGNTNAGLALVDEALNEITEASLVDFSLVGMVFCVAAYSNAVRGDHGRSVELSDHARALVGQVTDVIDRSYIHAHLLLGQAALERGDADEARRDLTAARNRLHTEPEAVMLHDWADRLHDEILHARGFDVRPVLTAAETRVLEQLPTHRSLAEIGEHLFVSRNTVKSHTMSIYRKLGVAGRSEAVRLGKELDLL